MIETATRAEFCKAHGIVAKNLAHLVATRRIALTPDGKYVLVAESLDRLKSCRNDPGAAQLYPLPLVVNRAELAQVLGFKQSYLYQLESADRLVHADDGKLFLLAQSIQRIKETRDPSKAGVAARHAAERGADVLTGHAEKQSNQPLALVESAQAATESVADKPAPDADGEGAGPAGFNYQTSKAKREHFAALEAEASYLEKMRQLLPVADVRSVLTETMTVLRTAMEGLPYNLAPQLAATMDEAQVKSILANEVEHALQTAADSLAKLGRGEL